MSHAFKPTKPEDSPYYNEEYMVKFEQVRAITTKVRPPGTHGCKLTEIVPGLWTAHFEDFNQPDSFKKLPITPPIGLVVNAAVAYNQCPTYQGFYGPDIQVLPIPLYDDPKVGEAHPVAGDAKQYFGIVNESIRKTIASNKSAIVHCYASLSRSICYLIAYLMETHNMSLLDATKFVKDKWDATYPNDSFVFQLIAYENELIAKKASTCVVS